MGQTLSAPDTKKKTESGGNDRYLYSVTEMQGWRITMEDAHAALLDLDGESNSNGFFAVYDGHGGGRVSKYAGEHLHKRLLSEEKYRERSFETALKKAFLGTDEDLLASRDRDSSGATAVAALLTTDNKIFVANAGDSRSVIGIKGEAKPLSYDHKPTNESEKARICAAGGYIDFGRVNGNLALSRALGDFEYKKNNELVPEKQIITADPDVICHEVTEEDEFLVLACDGIWDCLSSQQVVDIVRHEVSQGKELSQITELICDHCLAPDTTSRVGIGCDNMTVLLVAILHGRTKEEWYSWIADRVKNKYGYETPSEPPQLYSLSRLMSFRARQEALDAREAQIKSRKEDESPNPGSTGVARILGSTGGISFSPGSSIFHDNGTLMFTGDDSDDDIEDMPGFNDIGIGESDELPSDGPTKQVAESEKDMQGQPKDEDGDTKTGDSNVDETPQSEAPQFPKPLPNGDSKSEQLHSQPGGDAPVKTEGLLDASEDPIKI